MTPQVTRPLFADVSVGDFLTARDYLANTGGPSSRSRNERLSTTLLGRETGGIQCPCVLRVGIDFEQQSPLNCVETWMAACGFADARDAVAALPLPAGPRICRPDPNVTPEPVSSLLPFEGLRLALVLGLSTSWLYDPRRPVLWTHTSLTRRLALFDGRGFYAS